ncbi:hypothetical protein RE432_18480 [Pusillimonas sp. SM2304]|uniref:hypothetical protein n=1 Tax=Pusillimonas sp. SM2304 TaxID=3073241 RepID=UPI002876A35F|nr:hypothetical protein [Pusillimonas sp. SM2304]MDS1142425.1 hypothetical protein [Pusillimonas sp. SM2304]
MKRLILAALMAGMFTTVPTMAKNNGCQGNCPGGDTINNTTNQGGTGLGVGVGVGIGQGGAGGQGGSVVGSGNSSNINANLNANRNANSNRNTNKQGQQQGQLQGQQQAAIATQSQSSRNDNRSSASNEGNNSNQSVTVQGDNHEAPRIPVATAYAPALVAGTNTCMGSSSVGGQGITFGLSLGTTWEDDGCTRRSNAATLFSLGQTQGAVALMCQDKDIAQAMETAGTPCPGAAQVAQAPAASPVATTATAQIASVQPIVTPIPPRVERYTITAAGIQRTQ